MPDVSEIINDARNYAEQSFSQASNLVDSAVTAAQGVVTVDLPSPPRVNLQSPLTDPEWVDLPDVDRYEREAEAPDVSQYRAEIEQRLNFQLRNVSFADITVPRQMQLEFPSAPSLNVGEFTRETPALDDPSLPAEPTLVTPDRPTLGGVDLPPAPTVTLPGFSPTRPDALPDAPDAAEALRTAFESTLPEMRSYLEGQVDAYIQRHSPNHYAIMGRLEERLSEMVEGGTALPEAIEQRIHDRARARNEAEGQASERRAAEEFARRGFTMPPGALSAALREVRQNTHNQNVDSSSQIAINQANLEQQNIQFALQLTSTIRQALLQGELQWAATLAQLNRDAITYAQAVSNAVVQTYNLLVGVFQSQVSLFQAEAQVYDVELRAALANVQLFEALIRAEESRVRVNTQLLEQYRLDLETQRTQVQIYTERLQAVRTVLEQNQLRLQAFRTEIDAYNASLQAQSLESQLYEAAIRGENLKVQTFATQIDAYRAQVQARAEEARVNQEEGRFELASVQAYLEMLRTETQIFTTEAQVESDDYRNDLELYRIALSQLTEEIRYEMFDRRERFELEARDLDLQIKVFESQRDFALEDASRFVDAIRRRSEIALAGANVYANIASATLSAQNSMVSLVEEVFE